MAEANLFEKYGITVDADKVIFREGETGDEMYIIQSGNIKITKSLDGKEHTLAVLGKGDFFGEMALINHKMRTANAIATTTVKMLSFDRLGFLGMIESNGKLALNIIDKLCRRLNNANQQIQYLVQRNEKWLIATNLNYAFVQNGLKSAKLDSIKLSRELALNLEISIEKVMGYMSMLDQQGIIVIEDNIVTLRQPEKLAALVENSGRLKRNS